MLGVGNCAKAGPASAAVTAAAQINRNARPLGLLGDLHHTHRLVVSIGVPTTILHSFTTCAVIYSLKT